jgi:hypothetical protein
VGVQHLGPMTSNRAEEMGDLGDMGVSLVQKMLSAVSGSVLTSLLGTLSLCFLRPLKTQVQCDFLSPSHPLYVRDLAEQRCAEQHFDTPAAQNN